MLDKLVTIVKSLSYREVGIIIILLAVSAPGYLLWWGTKNPDLVIDIVAGEHQIDPVDDCIQFTYRQRGQRRYRLTYTVTYHDDATITLSASSFQQWNKQRGIELCRELKSIRAQLQPE